MTCKWLKVRLETVTDRRSKRLKIIDPGPRSKILNGNPILVSMATQSTVGATNVLYNASEFFYNVNVPSNIFSQFYFDMELESFEKYLIIIISQHYCIILTQPYRGCYSLNLTQPYKRCNSLNVVHQYLMHSNIEYKQVSRLMLFGYDDINTTTNLQYGMYLSTLNSVTVSASDSSYTAGATQVTIRGGGGSGVIASPSI